MRIRNLVSAAVMIAAGTTAAAPSASAAPDHGLSFNASVSGAAVLTSPTTGTFAGSGNAEHMGEISNNGGVLAHPDEPSNTCPNGFLSTNSETFTAANGDAFSISSSDVTCPVGPPGQYRGGGHWSVVPGSGTGRFTGVTGDGSYSGVADFSAQTFSFTFTGRIS